MPKASGLWQWAQHALPILRWAPSYEWRKTLLGDVIAGLTVTAVAAPEAVSYAGIAGLPAAQGLYTGFLAPLAYAVAGASPQLIVGPTAMMCVLTATALPATWDEQPVEAKGAKEPSELRVALAGSLAMLVALLQMAMAVLRLGGLVSVISTPVVAGFTTGSAILTASSQFSTLLGLPKCVGAGGGSCTLGEALQYIVDNGSSIKGGVCVMTVVCIAILVGVKFGPQALRLGKRWQLLSNLYSLVLVVIAVPLVAAYGPQLEAWGMEAPKSIPAGLPSAAFPFPTSSTSILHTRYSSDWAQLVASAIPLALIGYIGAATICKTAARQNGPYATHPQQELWGQVACNAACAIGQGLPITGSFSRTAVNASSGARTGLASLLTAVMMMIALETITGPLSQVPSVARAAIVIVAIAKMVEVHMFPKLWKTDKRDFVSFTVTVVVTSFVSASGGLLAGVGVSWLLTLTRTRTLPVTMRLHAWRAAPAAATTPAAAMLPKGGYIVGAAAAEQLAARGLRWVDCSSYAGAQQLVAAAGSAADAAVSGDDSGDSTFSSASITGSLNGGSSSNSSSNSNSGSGTSGSGCCVSLDAWPDLSIAAVPRLEAHISEARELLRPAVLHIAASHVAVADSTGLQALLDASTDGATAVPPCAVVVSGLAPRLRAMLMTHAAEEPVPVPVQEGGSGSGGGGIVRLQQLYVAGDEAAALAWAAGRCAAAALSHADGGAASDERGEHSAILLADGEDNETALLASKTAAATAATASSAAVSGVPPSPVTEAAAAARRVQAAQRLGAPASADDDDEDEQQHGDSNASLLRRVQRELTSAGVELAHSIGALDIRPRFKLQQATATPPV